MADNKGITDWEEVPIDDWEEVPVDRELASSKVNPITGEEIQPGQTHFYNPKTKRTEELPKELQRGDTDPLLETASDMLQGAGEGVSLGFSEEITAPFAAAALDPKTALKTMGATAKHVLPFIDPSEEDYAAVNKYSDLMQQYRDIARERQELAQERSPIAYTGGAVAGGMVLPGGVAAKAGKPLASIIKGGATGAGFGAATGLGIAEGDLPERLDEATEGAVYGGGLGILLPGLGAAKEPASKIVKGAKEAIAETDLGRIFSKYRQKEGALSKDVAENVATDLRNYGDEIVNTVKQKANEIRAKQQANLEVSNDVKSMKNILNDASNKLQELETHANKEIREYAKKLNNQLKDYSEGVVTTKLQPKTTAAEKQLKEYENTLKAYNKLNAKRVAQGLDNQEEVALNELAMKKAEMEAAEGVSALDFPELHVSDEGKRVASRTMVGEKAGEAFEKKIIQRIEDKKLTPIELDVDPDTGLKYLKYKDLETGRIEMEPIPESVDIVSVLKPVKGRFGSKYGEDVEMLPTEREDLLESVRQYTKVDDDSLKTPGRIREEASQIIDEIKELRPENLKETKEQLSSLLALQEMLTGKEPGKFLSPLDKLTIRNKLEKLLASSNLNTLDSGNLIDIVKGFKGVKGLEELAPEAMENLTKAREATEILRLYAHLDPKGIKTIVPNISGQLLAQTGGIMGLAAKGAKGAGSFARGLDKITNEFITHDPAYLGTLAIKLKQTGSATANKIANVLDKAVQKDDKSRNALLFGIMQNPAYREEIRKIEEQENE